MPWGCRASSLKALTTFSGLAHRFQLALEHNGVRWINDSKATNVGSRAALNGLHVDGTCICCWAATVNQLISP
jgi:UDP-N-acetylmuramoylalanine--D-glutamate ligase